jgi:hypothetical protein
MHYPVNDHLALDLQNHLDQMAKVGWELVSTQQLINEHSSTTPQMIFFWEKRRKAEKSPNRDDIT